ncbi:cell wall / vacuolar inhibitor of fructosidase 2-like [Papaver somniferum]|uniref:cell wall / vacuolar inhibitor of fructosidase 2-like n=1 Tax=Papaver somniferum TaxID=3469 RepID=UPI000E6F51DA|nr:cell wall / vacuolar inhibitor of fructosidase 2-like [Papaver somniferum]
MASSVVYLISILSLIFIVQESSVLVSGDDELIHSTCQKTRSPELCEVSLIYNPASKEADVKGITKIITTAGENSASDTAKFILKYIVGFYTDPDAVEVVTGCIKSYDNAKTALDISIEDLSSDHLANALKGLEIGASYADDCKNSFSSASPPLEYPDVLRQKQRYFQDLCGVSSDIIQVLRS